MYLFQNCSWQGLWSAVLHCLEWKQSLAKPKLCDNCFLTVWIWNDCCTCAIVMSWSGLSFKLLCGSMGVCVWGGGLPGCFFSFYSSFHHLPWLKWLLAHMLLISAADTHARLRYLHHVMSLLSKWCQIIFLNISLAMRFMSVILAKSLQFSFKKDWVVFLAFYDDSLSLAFSWLQIHEINTKFWSRNLW